MNIIDYTYRKPDYLEENNIDDIDTIIVHNTGNNNTLKTNTDYHIDDRAWNWCGYGYYVSNGQVYKIRGIEYKNANARNHNHHTIGIAIQGDYEKNIPSDENINLVVKLIVELKEKYPNIKYIKGHNEFNDTICPGKNMQMQKIREMVNVIETKDNKYDILTEDNEFLKVNNIELIAEIERLDKLIRKDREKYDKLKEIYKEKVKDLQELREINRNLR